MITPFIIGGDTLIYGRENIFLAKYNVGDSCLRGGEPITFANPKTYDIPQIIHYPNPSSMECTISCLGNSSYEGTIAIYNIAGAILHLYSLSNKNTTFSTADLPTGIYQYKIKLEGIGYVCKKMVVIR